MQNAMWLICAHLLIFPAACWPSHAGPDDGNIYYQNCGDIADYELPLMGCSKITIGKNFTEVWIRDNGEKISPKLSRDQDFLALDSALFPISIPVSSYESKRSWDYGGMKYIKVRKVTSRLTEWHPVDAIVVIRNPEVVGDIDMLIPFKNPLVFDNAVLTFWYSEKKGVSAIGIPATHSDGAEVFICSSRKCLFQP